VTIRQVLKCNSCYDNSCSLDNFQLKLPLVRPNEICVDIFSCRMRAGISSSGLGQQLRNGIGSDHCDKRTLHVVSLQGASLKKWFKVLRGGFPTMIKRYLYPKYWKDECVAALECSFCTYYI